MEETLFYVFGLALVVSAIVVSALGLRLPSFPTSGAALAGLILYFTLLVSGTATFAVLHAEEEQAHREAEAAELAEEGGAEEPAEEPAGGEETTTTPPDEGGAAEGEALFTSQGCSSCHSLQAAGATGTTGPNLDEALAGQSTEFIEESIVDPGAEVAQGYPDGIMPTSYGQDLTPEQLAALVQYLATSTGAQQ